MEKPQKLSASFSKSSCYSLHASSPCSMRLSTGAMSVRTPGQEEWGERQGWESVFLCDDKS